MDRLPPGYLPPPKEDEKTIPLTLLRQKPPDAYRLDAGDVLGVYIEGVLGDKNQPPPGSLLRIGQRPAGPGLSLPVREDGDRAPAAHRSRPGAGPDRPEAEKQIIKAYTVEKKILQPDAARIIVTLVKPREYHVLVVRQDSGGVTLGPAGTHRQHQTRHRREGGPSGLRERRSERLDAHRRPARPGRHERGRDPTRRRRRRRATAGAAAARLPRRPVRPAPPRSGPVARSGRDGQMVRIPFACRRTKRRRSSPEDVVLQTGDIVFIEARDTEVYYTGGLLFARQFVLPRDYDLRMRGRRRAGRRPAHQRRQTQNNLSGSIIASGLGSPSPSQLSVIRKTKCKGEVDIKVDLNRALRDPRENI